MRSPANPARRKALTVIALLAAAGLGAIPLNHGGRYASKYPESPGNRVRLPPNGKTVCILGGGISGLQTALELTQRGYRCTILERSGTPGGKVKSWRDRHFGPDDHSLKQQPGYRGIPRDHGLHGIWGFYHNLREFMGRHGFELQDVPDGYSMYTFIDAGGATNFIGNRKMPAPYSRLEQVIQYLRFRTGDGDFGELVRIITKLMGFDYQDIAKRNFMDSVSVAEYLRRENASPGVASYFEGILDMGYYDSPEDTSALSLACIFQLLSGDASDTDVNIFKVPAGEHFVAPMERQILAGGGDIHYHASVDRLIRDGDRMVAVVTEAMPEMAARRCEICGGVIFGDDHHDNCPFCGAHGSELRSIGGEERSPREFRADHFVCALDVPGIQRLLSRSDGFREEYFVRIGGLKSTSVYVVNLWYDDANAWARRLDPVQRDAAQFFATGFEYIGQTINWARFGSNGKTWIPEYQDFLDVSVIETHIADAARISGMLDRELADNVHRELVGVMPGLPPYRDFYINKWHNYTAYAPGSEVLRPHVESPLANLFLVGDYVNVESPAVFMEKTNVAARLACNAVLARDGMEAGKLEILPSGTPGGLGSLLRRFG